MYTRGKIGGQHKFEAISSVQKGKGSLDNRSARWKVHQTEDQNTKLNPDPYTNPYPTQDNPEPNLKLYSVSNKILTLILSWSKFCPRGSSA